MITYPNSESIRLKIVAHGFATGLTTDYDALSQAGYHDPYDIYYAVDKALYAQDNDKDGLSPIIDLLLLAVGIFNVCKPETAWMLNHGWRYKHAEPFDAALAANCLGGVVAILFGVLCLFASIF